ncbi:hypothetical protein VTK26DRAFT_6082 [Humicola hyalothermophila]
MTFTETGAITTEASSTPMTVEATSLRHSTAHVCQTYTDLALETVTVTKTVVDALTVAISNTKLNVSSVTTTALTTKAVVVNETVTVAVISTQTTTAQASLITKDVADFRAVAREHRTFSS